MRRGRPLFSLLAFLSVFLCAVAASAAPASEFVLTIAHVNDTHSHLEPTAVRLRLDGKNVVTHLGGYARLKSALDAARKRALDGGEGFLALHAGDAVQGTPFFGMFAGRADFDLLNMLGLDAMALGNHEFDRGPDFTARLVGMADFPIVAANADASAVPALAARLKPYIIKKFKGAQVGIVGLDTPETANVSRPGDVRFLDPAATARRVVRALRSRGVRIVIVLSHLGYAQDIALARRVPGIAVIVGGHSHSLLGDSGILGSLGLAPEGPYPTEVAAPGGGRTLVVQAWNAAMELGVLRVAFDASGRVVGCSGHPFLLAGGGFSVGKKAVPAGSRESAALRAALLAGGAARLVPEDPAVLRRLAPYAAKLDAFRNASIGASAAEDLVRGTSTDPGPLVAEAFLAAAPGARVAILMPGNVRADILRGAITRGAVMNVLPFDEGLETIELDGGRLKAVLEDAADFSLAKGKTTLFYVAGLSCRVAPSAAKGSRVRDLRVRDGEGRLVAVDPGATYRLVTNEYLAAGGDGLASLKKAPGRRAELGMCGSDALTAHFRELRVVRPPREGRVVVGPPSRPLSLLPPSRPPFGRDIARAA